ncbi:MAG: DUF4136 domain-containing protein [Polaromonas sp.]
MTACSGMRVVDSDVTAFSAWTAAPPVPGTRYRFERLPSQQSANTQQDRIEALATTSLSKVGMALSPLDARYSVQVLLVTEIAQRYPEPGFGFGGPGVSIGGGSRGSSIGFSFPIGFGDTYFKRTVSVLMRELASQKVVFETRAMHDGPYNDAFAVLPAMLDSALLGFPQPPAGTRRINVEIPR